MESVPAGLADADTDAARDALPVQPDPRRANWLPIGIIWHWTRPHVPLVAMLVLTQASAGLWLASAVAGWAGSTNHFKVFNSGSLVLLVAGLSASVFHLGRPGKAWRAFLGWRRSWLSREIIALQGGAVTGIAAVAAAWTVSSSASVAACTGLAAAVGLAAVGASSMVYVDTGRPCWRARYSFGNFFGTTLLLGAALSGVAFGWLEPKGSGPMLDATPLAVAVALAILLRTALFGWRWWELRRALHSEASPIHWNARVVRQLLPATIHWQTALFVVSVAAGLIAVAGWREWSHVGTTVLALATFASEWVARQVYFVAGGARRMPGGLPS